MRVLNEIAVHCLATPNDWWEKKPVKAVVNEVRRWHVEQRGWSDIGYHFIIHRDGTVAEGRPIERAGAHIRGRNKNSVAIALNGGKNSAATDQFSDNFTEAQDRSLRSLIAELHNTYGDMPVNGHNQYAAKACPGFNVPRWYAKKPERKLAESKTVQGAAVASAGTVGTVATAVLPNLGKLSETAQLALIGLGAVTIIGLLIVFRERIKGWSRGWK